MGATLTLSASLPRRVRMLTSIVAMTQGLDCVAAVGHRHGHTDAASSTPVPLSRDRQRHRRKTHGRCRCRRRAPVSAPPSAGDRLGSAAGICHVYRHLDGSASVPAPLSGSVTATAMLAGLSTAVPASVMAWIICKMVSTPAPVSVTLSATLIVGLSAPTPLSATVTAAAMSASASVPAPVSATPRAAARPASASAPLPASVTSTLPTCCPVHPFLRPRRRPSRWRIGSQQRRCLWRCHLSRH